MNVLEAAKLPDLFSLLNALFGFSAIMAAHEGQVPLSMLLIILAAAVDGLDGFLARKVGAGPLGADLDSFSDLISFGLAPAFLALTSLHLPAVAWGVGGLYLMCGALRLARFNVSPGNSQFFEGLPIPAAGILVVASLPLLQPEITLLFMLLFSLLMVSSISYAKVRDSRMAFILIAIVMAELFMIFIKNYASYAAILLTTTVLYLVSPVVIGYLQRERSQPSRRA